MRIPLAVAFLIASAVPAWAQEDQEDQEDRSELERKIKEMRREIWEKELEVKGLRTEFQSIWADLYGAGPQYLSFSAKGLLTWWDNDLGLARNVPGIGFDSILGHRASGEEGNDLIGFSLMPFGFRYWWAEDRKTERDVTVVSYRLLGFSGEYRQWRTGGMRFSIVGGLTRFASEIPGVRGDTGPALSTELEFFSPAASGVQVGGGGTWDIVRTSFQVGGTETVHNLSVMLTVKVSF